jgi:hypothetical protein
MMVRIPCPSLENMSGEIRSNGPYSSFGIWLYHFNSVKHILIPFFSSPDPKGHVPFFLFLAWWPSWLEVGITGHNFGRGSSKDHSTKVWFKLALWLQRSWLKCEKLTDGRRTTDDGRSVVTIAHMTLWVRWAKKMKMWNSHRVQC